MKLTTLIHLMTLLVLIATNNANARPVEINLKSSTTLPSSLINTLKNKDQPLSCKADSIIIKQSFTSQRLIPHVDKNLFVSLVYLNDVVETTYTKMRNGVISYVTTKVALSLFSFSTDGFSAEKIADYVSDGTKPYLPFEFANGVKITKVTPKGSTVIYRTEMPISKSHSLALPLALAGWASAKSTICNDMEIVDDLLGRDVVIQYDYYDSKGIFFKSFTING